MQLSLHALAKDQLYLLQQDVAVLREQFCTWRRVPDMDAHWRRHFAVMHFCQWVPALCTGVKDMGNRRALEIILVASDDDFNFVEAEGKQLRVDNVLLAFSDFGVQSFHGDFL